MKKAVVLAVLVVLLSFYFVIAQEIESSNDNNNPPSETAAAGSSLSDVEIISGSECGFFCKIGKFLWGDAANRAGMSWFERGALVGETN